MFKEFDNDQRGLGEPDPMGRRRRGGPGHGHGGPGGHFRYGSMRRDGRRARGDVRAAVLVLLDEQPRNGYQLIQELTERSNDAWRPSPGSIYPVLQQLEDEGLIAAAVAGTGRTYELTEAGRALVAEQRDELGKPWENTDTGGRVARELMGTARDVVLAARQVMVAGSASQVAKATAVLVETRRSLYGILAEGDQDS
ncbi:MAG: helix-turn-helix transcriptional regulator [Acidimicrobiales bacterium]